MKHRNLANSKASHTINRLEGKSSESPKVTSTRFIVGYFLRNGILTPDKECSIYMQLSYGSRRRLAYATGYFCKPADFDAVNGTVTNNDDITRLLAMQKSKAIECFTDMKLTKRPINLQIIKAYSLDLEIEGIPTATQCFERFWLEVIETQHKIGDVQDGTCRRLNWFQRYLVEYIRARHGNRVALSSITPADAQACLLWLRNHKNLSNDVAMRVVGHFKRVLDFAVANEWIQRNPLMMFRKKMENKRQESLTVDELNTIKDLKFASDVLDQVRDIFVFSCYTGLGYNEVSKLTPAHIKVADGKLCIFQARDKTRKRTNNEAYVPLGYDALEILNRYDSHPVCLRKGVCLPVQANQRVNTYLKQIQHLAGIKKRLTTHVARRTFATHRINEGFEAVVVSAMMAHSDISTTMRYYAKVSPEAVVREFERVKSKNG